MLAPSSENLTASVQDRDRPAKPGLKKLRYAFFLAKRGGVGTLLRQFRERVYGNTTYVWLVKELRAGDAPPPYIPYSLREAEPGAFRYLLDGINGEASRDAYEMLRRLSYHSRGFAPCYLAFTPEGEVCHFSWLLSARSNKLIRTNYPAGMRELKDDEVLQENSFTFPRFRGKGVMTAVTLALAEMARKQGFRRVLAYVDRHNVASLKAFRRAGFMPFDEDTEVRRLMRIWRRNGH